MGSTRHPATDVKALGDRRRLARREIEIHAPQLAQRAGVRAELYALLESGADVRDWELRCTCLLEDAATFLMALDRGGAAQTVHLPEIQNQAQQGVYALMGTANDSDDPQGGT